MNTSEDSVYGLPKVKAGGDPMAHLEIIELRKLIDQEKGHCIWKK